MTLYSWFLDHITRWQLRHFPLCPQVSMPDVNPILAQDSHAIGTGQISSFLANIALSFLTTSPHVGSDLITSAFTHALAGVMYISPLTINGVNDQGH